MVYKRRAIRPRKKVVRIRRKKPSVLASAKKINLKRDLHYISRHAPGVDITSLSNTGATVATNLTFKLSDVTNSTEFSDLFDNYMLVGITLTFRLMQNPDANNQINSTLFSNAANFYPKLWWVIDKDDGSVPTLTTIRERSMAKCRILKPNAFVTVHIKMPKPLLTLQSSAITVAPTQWLRTTEPTVEHYGIKLLLDKMGYSGTLFTVGIDKKYFFAFKNSK